MCDQIAGRKRPREDAFAALELRRVAEIVIALASAGQLRGAGKEPTVAEKALAAEARSLLAGFCEVSLRPKDLFSSEAVRAIVGDLGLGGPVRDDSSAGSRVSKPSIAERLLQTKKRMEEAERNSQLFESGQNPHKVTAPLAPHRPGGLISNPAAVAFSHVRQQQTREIYSAGSLIKPSGSSVVDGHSTSHMHMGQASPMIYGQVGKSAGDNSARYEQNAVQRSNQAAKKQEMLHAATPKQQMILPASVKQEKIVQASHTGLGNIRTGLLSQGMPSSQVLSFSSHADIAKKVQQVLPHAQNHPSWTPPSNDYMNTPLLCQVCKITIADTDSLLVCDSCERGTHLKCLAQVHGITDIPKLEWHCATCLASSTGKPLPPKYGKVTRTISTPVKPGVPTAGSHGNVSSSSSDSKKIVQQEMQKGVSAIASTSGSTVHNVVAPEFNARTSESVIHTFTGSVEKTNDETQQADDSSNLEEGEKQCHNETVSQSECSLKQAYCSEQTQCSIDSFSDSKSQAMPETEMQTNAASSGDAEDAVNSNPQIASIAKTGEDDQVDSSKLKEGYEQLGDEAVPPTAPSPAPAHCGEQVPCSVGTSIGCEHQSLPETGVQPGAASVDTTGEADLVHNSEAEEGEKKLHYDAVSQGLSSPKRAHCDGPQPHIVGIPSESETLSQMETEIQTSSAFISEMLETTEADHFDSSKPEGTTTAEMGGCGIDVKSVEEVLNSDKTEDHVVSDPSNEMKLEASSIGNIKDHNSSCNDEASNGVNNTGSDDVGSIQSFSVYCNVEWVGSPIEVCDGRSYYSSCVINGLPYKLYDHVVVASDCNRCSPSKLQSLWQEQSGLKMAIVEPYVFPSDVPASVCQPSPAEDNEVYATKTHMTITLDSVSSPCEVLPLDKFREKTSGETESTKKKEHYFCRWRYDESTGSFDPVTC